MSILDNMPHESTIRRIVRTRDSMAGSRDSFVNERTEEPCWEQQASAKEVMEFEKRGMQIDTKVFYPSNPNVTERHQIVITRRNGEAVAVGNQVVMDVVAVPEPDASAGLGIVWRVMCNRLTGADN
jgi:hypothetical protein